MRRPIAIVTPTFPPYRGGMGVIAALDARQLAALGFDVHVFTPAADGREDKGLPFTMHRLRPLVRYGNAAFVPGVAALAGATILLHYPFFGGAEPLAAAKRYSGKGKLIVTYHMDVVGTGPLAAAFKIHTRWLMPRILRAADRVLVTSRDYAEHGNLAAFAPDAAPKIREMPPAVDVARFAPGPKSEELLRRHGLAGSDRIVTFVGGLDKAHYFKGIPVLLRALSSKDLAGVKAVIVGGGDLRPGFENEAKALGIAARVVFAGPVSDAELPEYHRLGDVFAFPSVDRSEAFGIAALEAAASGVPVVASDLPGVRTVVVDGDTGWLVEPGDVDDLADRIRVSFIDTKGLETAGA
ncbi:MAG TPA: glycosyltransferase family 4 protein, partial [Patescibacteria group bacterium]|nr:glycosyltransferase family 4 protein [Patescibacteria group bacterium]